MIKVKKLGVVLKKTDLSFENDSVLNPGIMQEGTILHMLYRAVRKGNYSTIGYCKLDGPMKVVERYDTPLLIPFSDDACKGVEDPRIVKIDGIYYITYTAYDGINALGALVTSTNLKTFDRHGIIVPKFSFDEFKRLADCNNLVNAKYFRHVRHFEPNDQIFLWDKDVMFFPRRIDGKLAFIHRIRPGIQLVMVNSLEELTKDFWSHYFLHFNE
ncbi:MAG: pesticidal protein Cry7Aa, partial [Flavobacteriaceae bacterium]|nr:pesticidal protein Cry7Aa [Flavobacteriaceae bacterium]